MPNNTDGRWEAAKQELADAAAKAGIDPGVMAKIAGFESQYNPNARPIASHKHAELNTVTQFDGVKAMSSAHGYGQFTNATWTNMVHQYGEKYGIANASELTDAQANAADLRNNTALQAGVLAEFTKQNIDKGARLGGPNADANVYALHNLGGSAGAEFLHTLKTNPNERVDSVLSQTVIERNPGLYGDGSGTVAEAYKVMGQQMDRYAKYASDIQHVTPNQTDVTQPAPARHGDMPATATHTTSPRSSVTQESLNIGKHGDDIRALQDQLGQLGYTDAKGKPLHADGHFGPATKAAVESFQRDHHLSPDGVVGPLTQRQLNTQSQLHTQRPPHEQPLASQDGAPSPLLSHPSHPDNALFQQAWSGVQKLDAQHGRASDQRSENFAAALTTTAHNNGLSRIDHVVLSGDASRAWAVQGDLRSPFKQVAEVNVIQAIDTPVAQSTATLAQQQQQQTESATQNQAQQFQQQQSGPAMQR